MPELTRDPILSLYRLQAQVQENIDKVAAALGESNLFGAVFTIQQAADSGLQTGGFWAGGSRRR